MFDLDFDPLRYCRAANCDREDLHLAHGPSARTIRVMRQPVEAATSTTGLVDTVYRHVGVYVPTPFHALRACVNNDYGTVTDRSIQRALAALISDRAIASLNSAAWAPRLQRSGSHPGFYLRYDSPRLWSPDGLQDLMAVVADHVSASRRATA